MRVHMIYVCTHALLCFHLWITTEHGIHYDAELAHEFVHHKSSVKTRFEG